MMISQRSAESAFETSNQNLKAQKSSRYTHISNEARRELIARYISGEKLIDVKKIVLMNQIPNSK